MMTRLMRALAATVQPAHQPLQQLLRRQDPSLLCELCARGAVIGHVPDTEQLAQPFYFGEVTDLPTTPAPDLATLAQSLEVVCRGQAGAQLFTDPVLSELRLSPDIGNRIAAIVVAFTDRYGAAR